ncbi:MAG: PIN domain-containing protein [Bacteroidales bacterium]
MKVFLDANILVTVLNKEYPVFTSAARILSLAENSRFQLYTSPLCLAIAFYFSGKKSGEDLAKKKIVLLTSKIAITKTDEITIKQTITNKNINYFEDGLEYYSALGSGCEVRITEDTGDFYLSEIEVIDCNSFLNKYF